MQILGLCDYICGSGENNLQKAVLKHARQGNLRRLVRALDQCNSVNNVRDEKGRTALHLAAIGGHKECLKELLRRRADPNMYVFSIVVLLPRLIHVQSCFQ
jgi:ankyrin repeat protein